MDYDMEESGSLAYEYDIIELSGELALSPGEDINQVLDPDFRWIDPASNAEDFSSFQAMIPYLGEGYKNLNASSFSPFFWLRLPGNTSPFQLFGTLSDAYAARR